MLLNIVDEFGDGVMFLKGVLDKMSLSVKLPVYLFIPDL